MVVFDVEFHFTFDIFSHLTLFHFISWLLRVVLRLLFLTFSALVANPEIKKFYSILVYYLPKPLFVYVLMVLIS